MKRCKTNTLLIVAVISFVLSGLLRKGVVVLRPVKDAAGMQVYRPDGKMLMESDPWGNITVNWESNLSLILTAVILVWCVVRVVRTRFGGSHV